MNQIFICITWCLLCWFTSRFCSGQVFQASYTKINTNLFGGGITDGQIWFDSVVGGIKLVYSPNNAVELYQFAAPLPTTFSTSCTNALINLPRYNQTWTSRIDFPYSSTAPTSTSSSCEPGSSTNCVTGTRITAVVSGNSMTYTIDRTDSSCGCKVAYVSLNVPPCTSCSSVVVTPSSGCPALETSCGLASPPGCSSDLGAISQILSIKLTNDACYGKFSVTMPGAIPSPGTVGLSSPTPTDACNTCPGAGFSCINSGTGLTKYKNANTGCGCEASDIGDTMLWTLSPTAVSGYFGSGTLDPTVTYNGQACTAYSQLPSAVGNVTKLWTLSSGIVCSFALTNGDVYTLSNYQTYQSDPTIFSPTRPCSTCLKPVDLMIVVDLSGNTSFKDVSAIQTYIKYIAYMFTISPPTTNIGIVTITPTGANLGLPLSSGVTLDTVVNAASGVLICSNPLGTDLTKPCCTGGGSLSAAITLASQELAKSTRKYTSSNILFITRGGFTDTLAQVKTALQTAQTTTNEILNFFSLAISRDPALLTRLAQIKWQNDVINFPLQSDVNLYKVFNRVYWRGDSQSLYTDIEGVVSGICGGNGNAACGLHCCGDCTCGTICVPPTRCRLSNCFNVTLTPLPPTTSTCCDYKFYTCPPINGGLCSVTTCDFQTDQCKLTPKDCPKSNVCYNYTCNPSTGNCDEIKRFSNYDLCNLVKCNTSDPLNPTVINYTNPCPTPLPCYTSKCNVSTGLCDYIPNPIVLPSPCHTVSCVNNQYVYTGCSPSPNPCYTNSCVSAICTPIYKCSPSDNCTNITCVNGVCNSNLVCPSYALLADGSYDKCRKFSTCSLSTGCNFNFKSCKPPSTCYSSSCLPSDGSCNQTLLCSSFEKAQDGSLNLCRPLNLTTACNVSGKFVCPYMDLPNCVSTSCINRTCNPAVGVCNATEVCPQNKTYSNGTKDLCQVLTSCAPGNCTYQYKCPIPNPTTCTVSNCNPSTGKCSTSTLGDPYNKCVLRTCNTSGLYLTNVTCPQASSPCNVSICNTTLGCVELLRCQPYELYPNGTQNWCRPLNRTSCTTANCTYMDFVCSASLSPCNTTQCDSTRRRCLETVKCPPFEITSGVANLCRALLTSSCNSSCNYTNINCTVSDPCQNSTCISTKGCVQSQACPSYEPNGSPNGNQCRPLNVTSCSTGTCQYYNISCQSTLPCYDPWCDPKLGCSLRLKCSNYENITGNLDFCRPLNQSSCSTGQCQYTNLSCPLSSNPCYMFTCINGNCKSMPVCPYNEPISPQNSTSNLCRIRDKCYALGNCTYKNATTCSSSNLCKVSACNPSTGLCVTSNNTAYNWIQGCGSPIDSCLVPTYSLSTSSCCTLNPKCSPNPDLCLNTTCVNGNCITNPITCPLFEPNPTCLLGMDMCKANVNCSAGKCLYSAPKSCPQPADNCKDAACNSDTGDCYEYDSTRCKNFCLGVICSPKNCFETVCNPTNGNCEISTTPVPSCVQDNPCVPKVCQNDSNICVDNPYDPSICQSIYGPPGSCNKWGVNPFFKDCCQILPKCNQQIDPTFLCMLLYCDNTTNGVCLLRDNSGALCPDAFKNGNDLCSPLVKCNNATGGCIYRDLGMECDANKTNPCFDSSCNPTTGQCEYTITSRCIPASKCHNVSCTNNACVKEYCSEDDGLCYINSTTTCIPQNNCTVSTCDPILGCIDHPFDLNTCSNDDPCMVLFPNSSKVGCCDLSPKCPTSEDPVCQPVSCSSGVCVTANYTEVCPPNQNTSGVIDYCQELTGCAFGACSYTPKSCTSNVPCKHVSCDSNTGNCISQDTCVNNLCLSSSCSDTTGACEISQQMICQSDYCQNTTCNPTSGDCVVTSSKSIDDCPVPADPCQVTFLNPSRPGCCDTKPKCPMSTSGCTLQECVNGTCVTSSFCSPHKCSAVSCDSTGGNTTCPATPYPCYPANSCFTVANCSELDTSPFHCTQLPITCVPPNNCYTAFCNDNSTVRGDPCVHVPVVCDDNDLCTNNTCDPKTGTCSFSYNCYSSDPCLVVSCNASQGCLYTPKKCDDHNACTVDVCLNGSCRFTNISCDDKNNCTDDSCDASLGCVNTAVDCSNSSTALGVDLMCGFWICNSSSGCVPLPKPCITYTDTSVSAVVVGASLGGGIIALIVLAVVIVVFGVGGGGAYAKFAVGDGSMSTNVAANPLYVSPVVGGNNPLHRASS